MSKSVNVDFVTRQIEVDTDGKEHFISAAMAAKDAEQSMINAQNAANAAEKIASDLGLVDEAVQTAVSSAGQASNSAATASNKADIATAKADIATAKASEASTSAATATTKADIATAKADAANVNATNAAQSYANADAVATQLTEYLTTKESLTAPAVDKTLLIEGAAADSKVVGRKLNIFDNKHNYVDYAPLANIGRAISTEGALGTIIDLSGYASELYSSVIIDCSEGDVFVLNADGSIYAPRLYCFVDSNNAKVGSSNATLDENARYGNPITISTPANAVKLIINFDAQKADSYLLFVPQWKIGYDKDNAILKAQTKFDRVIDFLGVFNSSPIFVYPNATRTAGEIYYIASNNTFRVFTDSTHAQDLILGDITTTIFHNTIDGKYYYYADGWFYNYYLRAPIVTFEDVNDFRDLSNITSNIIYDGTMMEQVYNKFDSLIEEFPDMLTKYDAAELANMEYPDYANYKTYIYKISNGVNVQGIEKLKMFILGGVHGEEIMSQYNCYVFAESLLKNVSDKNAFSILTAFDVYIMPCSNGWATKNMSRNNYNNININRNFGTRTWHEITIESSNSGSSPNSEFETNLVIAMFDYIEPNIFIDHHHNSGLNGQIYIHGKNEITQSLSMQLHCHIASALIREYPIYFGNKYNLFSVDLPHMPIETSSGYMSGTSTEYFTQKGCTLSMTVEISSTINFANGVYNPSKAYSQDAWSIADHTFRCTVVALCKYAIEQRAEFFKEINKITTTV